jgi:aryl-alcohol dehydrogenase-like predicted oxidoreductase
MNHEASTAATPIELTTRWFAGRRATAVGLGACREPGDDRASVIELAIRLGCRVLDTAPHYHGGSHECVVGEAVRQAVAVGVCTRDELIVSTKVGRIPELLVHNRDTLGYARLKAYIEETFLARRLFSWDELAQANHTFAPTYLRHSVRVSLDRLGLSRLDCVFLEAPEVQRNITDPTGFRRRMAVAFETLETLCASGRLGCYGVATDDLELDLHALVTMARTLAGEAHHFAAVQLPLSLLRQDALQAGAVARASALGLYVYARGCLDGGTPKYQLPDQLCEPLMDAPDASVALRWTQSAPGVGTALFGSRDPRHIRANLAAARLPLLAPSYFAEDPS